MHFNGYECPKCHGFWNDYNKMLNCEHLGQSQGKLYFSHVSSPEEWPEAKKISRWEVMICQYCGTETYNSAHQCTAFTYRQTNHAQRQNPFESEKDLLMEVIRKLDRLENKINDMVDAKFIYRAERPEK